MTLIPDPGPASPARSFRDNGAIDRVKRAVFAIAARWGP